MEVCMPEVGCNQWKESKLVNGDNLKIKKP
jgi:hypothetical protein